MAETRTATLELPFPAKWLIGCVIPASLLCFQTAVEAARLSWRDGRYNYVLVTLAVAVLLLYKDRAGIAPQTGSSERNSTGAWLAGACVAATLALTVLTNADLYWRYLILGLSWIAGFWYFYGLKSLNRACFPATMLLAAAPVPEPWIHRFEIFLQYMSADVSEAIFRAIGSTVYRDGLVFTLSTLNVEVARECSGIRSTTALILVVAVSGHLLLRNPWSKFSFLLLAIPAGILKNAVRIVTLAILGSDVSPDYLAGPLHRQGGPLFTLTAVVVLGPALWMLMRADQWKAAKQSASPPKRA